MARLLFTDGSNFGSIGDVFMKKQKNQISLLAGLIVLTIVTYLFGTAWVTEKVLDMILAITFFTWFILTYNRVLGLEESPSMKNELLLMILGFSLFYLKAKTAGLSWAIGYLFLALTIAAVFAPFRKWLMENLQGKETEKGT